MIQVPFGLFTTHHSIGAISLNGVDALLSAYARSRNDTKARMLPVVTTFHGEAFDDQPSRVRDSASVQVASIPLLGLTWIFCWEKMLFRPRRRFSGLKGCRKSLSIPGISERLWRLGRRTTRQGQGTSLTKPRGFYVRCHMRGLLFWRDKYNLATKLQRDAMVRAWL